MGTQSKLPRSTCPSTGTSSLGLMKLRAAGSLQRRSSPLSGEPGAPLPAPTAGLLRSWSTCRWWRQDGSQPFST
eukprot:778492-Alexandrium_andersonii.AAC.1